MPGERAVPGPDDLAGGGQLVEHRRGRSRHARGQHVGLERRGGQDGAGELLDHARDAVDAPQRSRRRAAADRPTGCTPCHRGRKTPSACGATGSTSARSAASDRRRSVAQHVGVAELVARAAQHVGPQPALDEHAGALEPAQASR